MDRPIHDASGKLASRWDDEPFPDLLGCPFCGGIPRIRHIGNDNVRKISVMILCKPCNLKISQGTIYGSFESAENYVIKNWNTRTPPTDSTQKD